jgi:hypothetical protein
MTTRILVGSLAIALLAAPPLAAQSPPMRAGSAFDIGVGSGIAGGRCERCIPSDASAMSGFLRFGRVITSNVVASVEWARWSRSQFDQQSRFDIVTVGAQWYPISGFGLSMRNAIGYGRTSYVQRIDPATYRTERSGFAYHTGFGYDIRVSDNVVVAPFITVNAVVKGGARVNGQPTPYDVSTSLLQYGMSVGLH